MNIEFAAATPSIVLSWKDKAFRFFAEVVMNVTSPTKHYITERCIFGRREQQNHTEFFDGARSAT